MLASEHPAEVKPWFQVKLPFTFNIPDVAGSPFTFVGGKSVYLGLNPGAHLLYTVGQHRISVFILRSRNEQGRSESSRALSFSIESRAKSGLQCYLVTDASPEEARKLISMFVEANRS